MKNYEVQCIVDYPDIDYPEFDYPDDYQNKPETLKFALLPLNFFSMLYHSTRCDFLRLRSVLCDFLA